jgi:hypothetical protein
MVARVRVSFSARRVATRGCAGAGVEQNDIAVFHQLNGGEGDGALGPGLCVRSRRTVDGDTLKVSAN